MLCDTEKISELCLQEAIAEEAERRRLHRKPFLRKATITVINGQQASEPAFCRDISRDGIGLLHGTSLEPGTEFSLAIPLVGRQLVIQCETNWSKSVGDQQHFSGNACHYITTPQSLVLLSAALSEELNRRLYRRYPFIRAATLEEGCGKSQTVLCRDVSQFGIGLLHRQPITPGRVTISMQSAKGASIAATADLRRCTSLGSGWFESGGRFPVEEMDDESVCTS